MESYNADQFNTDILNDLSQEICRDMDRAAKQYLLSKDYLRTLNVRLERALRDDRLALMYTLQVQRDSTSGMLCMYGEYLKRKAFKLQEIEAFREQACI